MGRFPKLVAVNMRLAPAEVAYILEHSGAGVLLHDPRYDGLVADTLGRMSAPPLVMRAGPGDGGDHERLLAGSARRAIRPGDERDLLAINYTSERPDGRKGVMYYHRGSHRLVKNTPNDGERTASLRSSSSRARRAASRSASTRLVPADASCAAPDQ